eukprot:767513-Hanusia_phi.AAC.3
MVPLVPCPSRVLVLVIVPRRFLSPLSLLLLQPPSQPPRIRLCPPSSPPLLSVWIPLRPPPSFSRPDPVLETLALAQRNQQPAAPAAPAFAASQSLPIPTMMVRKFLPSVSKETWTVIVAGFALQKTFCRE